MRRARRLVFNEEMLVWGGKGQGRRMLNSGARYDPRTDRCTPMATAAVPSPRIASCAVWTG